MQGLAVLLLEDNFIVALEAEDLLRGFGAASVAVISTVANGLQAITQARPDFAMLDINLGTETSHPVARRLDELAVPYVVVSGYGEDFNRADGPKVATVTKPFDRDLIRTAIAQTLGARA